MYHIIFHFLEKSLYLFVFVFAVIPDPVWTSRIGFTIMVSKLALLTGKRYGPELPRSQIQAFKHAVPGPIREINIVNLKVTQARHHDIEEHEKVPAPKCSTGQREIGKIRPLAGRGEYNTVVMA